MGTRRTTNGCDRRVAGVVPARVAETLHAVKVARDVRHHGERVRAELMAVDERNAQLVLANRLIVGAVEADRVRVAVGQQWRRSGCGGAGRVPKTVAGVVGVADGLPNRLCLSAADTKGAATRAVRGLALCCLPSVVCVRRGATSTVCPVSDTRALALVVPQPRRAVMVCVDPTRLDGVVAEVGRVDAGIHEVLRPQCPDVRVADGHGRDLAALSVGAVVEAGAVCSRRRRRGWRRRGRC